MEYLLFLLTMASTQPGELSPFSKEFECFLACCELGSFSRASTQLAIQQAGLSKLIDRLESQTGRKLFYRGPRGVEPTPFGHGLYRAFKGTEAQWRSKYRAFWEAMDEGTGTLTIGCHASVALLTFPKIYAGLMKRFPKLEIRSELDTSIETTRKVANHQVDLGIVVNPVKNADVISKVVCAEFVALWQAGGGRKDARVLFYNPDMFLSAKVSRAFRDRRRVEVASYEVIAEILRHGPFIGALPSSVARSYRLRQVGASLFTARPSLIWHRDRFPPSSRSKILTTVLKALE